MSWIDVLRRLVDDGSIGNMTVRQIVSAYPYFNGIDRSGFAMTLRRLRLENNIDNALQLGNNNGRLEVDHELGARDQHNIVPHPLPDVPPVPQAAVVANLIPNNVPPMLVNAFPIIDGRSEVHQIRELIGQIQREQQELLQQGRLMLRQLMILKEEHDRFQHVQQVQSRQEQQIISHESISLRNEVASIRRHQTALEQLIQQQFTSIHVRQDEHLAVIQHLVRLENARLQSHLATLVQDTQGNQIIAILEQIRQQLHEVGQRHD